MRKRFALWLCRELRDEIGTLKAIVTAATEVLEQNDKALVELSSQLNDLRNKLAELQRPVEVRQEFHSGRTIPRFARGERPRTGATT